MPSDWVLSGRRRIAVLLCAAGILTAVVVLVIEVSLSTVWGLGDPVLYDSSPVYGYRPFANQERDRFGVRQHFNNLGLRSDQDWDARIDDKILFLGDSVTYGGSTLDNREIFSRLSTEVYNTRWNNHFIDGNAGVNAWGMQNIHAFITQQDFHEAAIYVTTLAEIDFYRGLTRILGLPFYNRSPRFALMELWYYFCNQQNNARYVDWFEIQDDAHKRLVVDSAARSLKDLDDHIRSKGHRHLMFITPSRDQILGRQPKDFLVESALSKFDLHPIYFLDEVNTRGLTPAQQNALFMDGLHLTVSGHHLWAEMIADELQGKSSE